MAGVATARRVRVIPPFDPFRIVFRLLTSVRVALTLIGLVCVAALLGVVFPQAPDEVRASSSAYDAYIEFQRGRYGIFTTDIRRLGLFEVFHSYWFNGLVILLLVAVAVCTANRIPPIVRSVRRPVRRVNDKYFERAHHRADFGSPADPALIERALRRNHYKVECVERDGAIYLFADKLNWTQFGTFVSHLSLILFMSGAIVTKLVGFSTTILIPQGDTAPVFQTIHAGQLQVENVQAEETHDAAGNLKQYVSHLVVFREGKQICSGTSTVNTPLHCAGYTLHQTTFSASGVGLQVRDLSSGNIIYSETTGLNDQDTTPSPHLIVRDGAGNSLFDDNVVLAPYAQDGLFYAILPIRTQLDPSVQPLLVELSARQGLRGRWELGAQLVGAALAGGPQQIALPLGQTVTAAGYSFTIAGLSGLPVDVLQGLPGMPNAALLQLATSANGQQYLDVIDMGSQQVGLGTGDDQSGGQTGASGSTNSANDGAPAATVPAGAPPALGRLDLTANVPQVQGGYEYTFLGQRSISGITVRKDPGSTFIWVATALMLLGLGITFYLPRRRLWAKVTPERTYMAGIADRIVNFSAEMRRIGAAAGSPDALDGIDDEPI